MEVVEYGVMNCCLMFSINVRQLRSDIRRRRRPVDRVQLQREQRVLLEPALVRRGVPRLVRRLVPRRPGARLQLHRARLRDIHHICINTNYTFISNNIIKSYYQGTYANLQLLTRLTLASGYSARYSIMLLADLAFDGDIKDLTQLLHRNVTFNNNLLLSLTQI